MADNYWPQYMYKSNDNMTLPVTTGLLCDYKSCVIIISIILLSQRQVNDFGDPLTIIQAQS